MSEHLSPYTFTHKVLDRSEVLDLLGILTIHPDIKALGQWIFDSYGPIVLYENSQQDCEWATGPGIDMSIWWGCLHNREYTNPYLRNLYFFHEFCHMLINPGPETDPVKLARIFDDSERFASYMSEVWIHQELGWLKAQLPFGDKLLFEFFPKSISIRDGIELRNRIVEDDHFVVPEEFEHEQRRLQPYRGNYAWAKDKFSNYPLDDLRGFNQGFSWSWTSVINGADPTLTMAYSPSRNFVALKEWSLANA